MTTNLNGKVAVITGGGGVLCSMFAKKLAECGAKVAILDIKKDLVENVAVEIRSNGGEAIGVQCDITNPDSVIQAEREVFSTLGQYQILINGAGVSPSASATSAEHASIETLHASREEASTVFNLPADIVEKVMKINYIGTFNVTQVFSKRMAGVEGATIVNMSSMSAISPLTKQISYSASKAAVSNLTQWLSTHLATVGIRVNAIAPGFFSTSINKHLLFDADGRLSERSKKIIAGTPMGRFGEPEELLGALLFLCDSSVSGFVTGIVLAVDGGFSSYCGV